MAKRQSITIEEFADQAKGLQYASRKCKVLLKQVRDWSGYYPVVNQYSNGEVRGVCRTDGSVIGDKTGRRYPYAVIADDYAVWISEEDEFALREMNSDNHFESVAELDEEIRLGNEGLEKQAKFGMSKGMVRVDDEGNRSDEGGFLV